MLIARALKNVLWGNKAGHEKKRLTQRSGGWCFFVRLIIAKTFLMDLHSH